MKFSEEEFEQGYDYSIGAFPDFLYFNKEDIPKVNKYCKLQHITVVSEGLYRRRNYYTNNLDRYTVVYKDKTFVSTGKIDRLNSTELKRLGFIYTHARDKI